MVDRTLIRENPKVISRFTAVIFCLLLLMLRSVERCGTLPEGWQPHPFLPSWQVCLTE